MRQQTFGAFFFFFFSISSNPTRLLTKKDYFSWFVLEVFAPFFYSSVPAYILYTIHEILPKSFNPHTPFRQKEKITKKSPFFLLFFLSLDGESERVTIASETLGRGRGKKKKLTG